MVRTMRKAPLVDLAIGLVESEEGCISIDDRNLKASCQRCPEVAET